MIFKGDTERRKEKWEKAGKARHKAEIERGKYRAGCEKMLHENFCLYVSLCVKWGIRGRKQEKRRENSTREEDDI